MKLPVISGKDAVKAFGKLGYVTVRQTGSHIRMKHQSDSSKKPLSIPNHKVIGKGLLRKLLRDS
jgi:predicted RNA binding protein YcfA (HicA-like mRNA interferase family)